jgi:hypothetical protein
MRQDTGIFRWAFLHNFSGATDIALNGLPAGT